MYLGASSSSLCSMLQCCIRCKADEWKRAFQQKELQPWRVFTQGLCFSSILFGVACSPSSESTQEEASVETSLSSPGNKLVVDDPVERAKSVVLLEQSLDILLEQVQDIVALASQESVPAEELNKLGAAIGAELQCLRDSFVVLKDKEKWPLVMEADRLDRTNLRLVRAISLKDQGAIQHYASTLSDLLRALNSNYSI